jgi:hypothetical protein
MDRDVAAGDARWPESRRNRTVNGKISRVCSDFDAPEVQDARKKVICVLLQIVAPGLLCDSIQERKGVNELTGGVRECLRARR